MGNTNNSCCAYCNEKIKEPLQPFTLTDSLICNECAEKLRLMYPIVYIGKPIGKLREHPVFSDCTGLSEEQLFKCISNKETSSQQYTVDKIHLLDLQSFTKYVQNIEHYRDEIKRMYNDYDNIFRIDCVRVLEKLHIKQGIQKMLKYKNTLAVTGYVLCGKFHLYDFVHLFSGGQMREKEIHFMYYDTSAPRDGYNQFDMRTKLAENLIQSDSCEETVVEGRQVCMVIDWEGENPGTGDLIVSDD